MINTKLYIILILLLTTLVSKASYAQFVNVELVIEAELSASIEQELNFGNLIINSGLTEINIGDVNMGVFTIRAINTQTLYINMEYPNSLAGVDRFNADVIPLDLAMAYNAKSDVAKDAIELTDGKGYILVNDSGSDEPEIWKIMYLYLYGSIDIGNINAGTYEGTISLNIEYF